MARKKNGLLQGARVYLSGPMDFVASRAVEKQFGWRNRVSQFLQAWVPLSSIPGSNRMFAVFMNTAAKT